MSSSKLSSSGRLGCTSVRSSSYVVLPMSERKIATRRSFSSALIPLSTKNDGSLSDQDSHVVVFGSKGSRYSQGWEQPSSSPVVIYADVHRDTVTATWSIHWTKQQLNLQHVVTQLYKLQSPGCPYITVPVVLGALGTVHAGISRWLDIIPGHHNLQHLQKAVLLGSARILRKVMSSSV